MKNIVAIDMRYVENLFSGLSRFSINIFYNLIKNSINDDIYFIILLPPKHIAKDLNLFNDLDLRKTKIFYSNNKRGLRWKIPFFILDLSLYLKLRSENVDIFLSPYIDPPILPGIRVICTIHDLIFIRVKTYFNNLRILKRLVSEFRILLTLLYSNNILAVSETTKILLINRYKYVSFIQKKLNNITVIYNGVTQFTTSNRLFKNKLFNLQNDYILYVGDRRQHKNLFYTIELVKKYNETYNKNYNLIIAGSASYKNYNLQKFITSNPFVIEIRNPNDELLDYLYNNCISLMLLSFDEGFGIPIIEAASRSKKVVLSNIDVFKEIAPKNSLILNLRKENQHVKLLHDYINKEIKVDPQTIFDKWSWEHSSFKLKKLLLSHLS